jgi:hypothetical protein
MNIFILVEGKTERKIYPKWLKQLLPTLTKVDRPALINQNNYCIVSGNGYPSILGYLKESIDEANRIGTFDFFIVIADTDDIDIADRELEIRDYVLKNNIKLNDSTDFVIILQRCCIETWFLGNRKIFKKNTQDTELNDWIKHFNVSIDDPETMISPTNYNGAIGNFHKMYLKKMLAERHISYSEIQPNAVTEPPYLDEIIKRFEQTGHIATFGALLDFCKKLN